MKRFQILMAVLVGILGALLSGIPAAEPHTPRAAGDYAASLQGGLVHWKGFPITVRIVHDRHYTPALERLTRQGLQEWVTATGGMVGYQMVSTGGDVVVSFHPAMAFCDTEDIPYPHSRAIQRVLMRIGTRDPYGGAAPLSDSIVQAMIAHEWGHALGIQGHSPNRHDLMYWGIDDNRRITAADLGTLRLAYPGHLLPGTQVAARMSP